MHPKNPARLPSGTELLGVVKHIFSKSVCETVQACATLFPLLHQVLEVSTCFALVCLRTLRPPGGPWRPREGPRRAMGGLLGLRIPRGSGQKAKNQSFLRGLSKRRRHYPATPSWQLLVVSLQEYRARAHAPLASWRPVRRPRFFGEN